MCCPFATVVKVAIFGATGGNPSVLTAKKVCSIKRVDISQAESNKIKACALPSIHLPLTRDGHGCPKLNAQSFARMRNQQSVHMARVVVLFEG